LIVTGAVQAAIPRDVIIKLAARHRLPALYSDHAFVTDGGLITYGPDRVDQYRHAAEYVDRILKGEKPADLPVQAPTKYATPRLHHAARRRSGGVAVAVRAAVGDAAWSSKSPSLFANRMAAFSQGLPKQAVEGQNVAIEYRWGDGQWPEIARPFARL